jgi:hypothetical protein
MYNKNIAIPIFEYVNKNTNEKNNNITKLTGCLYLFKKPLLNKCFLIRIP